MPSSTETQYEESETDESLSSSSLSADEDEEEIKKELADVTFEELQKARSDGSHAFFKKRGEDNKLKRANKNRCCQWRLVARSQFLLLEMSSKLLRRLYVIHVLNLFVVHLTMMGTLIFRCCMEKKHQVIDTSPAHGIKEIPFKKRYNFLYENVLPAERQALKKELKKCKDSERVSEIEGHISWIDKQLKSDSTKNIETQILAKHKKKEREAAKQGKRPFYLKKSEIRKQRLIENYNHLKSTGKLESFIEKKRKKNAAKDHRFMPYRRPGDNLD